MSKKYFHPQNDFFRKLNLSPPTTVSHGTEDNIKEKLTQLKPINWRSEGPGKLVADTDFGKLVQFVSPDLICTGTDDSNNPILTQIGKE